MRQGEVQLFLLQFQISFLAKCSDTLLMVELSWVLSYFNQLLYHF